MDYLGRAVQQPRVLPRRSRSCSASRCRERVKWIRVLIAELQRISSHLVWFGTHGDGDRRHHRHALRVPRARDSDESQRAARRVPLLPELHPRRRPARGHPARLQGSGDGVPRSLPRQARRVRDAHHQEPDLARSHARRRRHHAGGLLQAGASTARSRAPPAATTTSAARSRTRGYETFEFDVIGASNGDVYDRYLVRVAEMRESVKICRQALERIAAGRRVGGQRPPHRAAAEGRGLHRDGSADSALPDLLAGLHRAGRRCLRAGRRAARRARLLHRVGRQQPPVARAHALARA